MNFQMSDLQLLMPHMILVGTALLVLMVEAFSPGRRRREATWISLAGIVGAAFFTPQLFGDARVGFSGMLAGDGFAGFFYFVFYLVGALTLLISENYLFDERSEHGEYHCLVLLSLVGMMLMASATHLLVFFLALETMSIAIYALAGYLRDERGVESSFKYFILGSFSSGFLLYGIALIYGAAGTTSIHGIVEYFSTNPQAATSPMGIMGVAMIVVGFAFKVGAVPFHGWTPDVYQGAPTSVTAFMATGVKAAAFASFLRIFLIAFPSTGEVWSGALWLVAVATMTLGNLAALTQKDIKRMLAYSSIAHGGYLLVGMVAGTAEAGSGMLFYLLTYALMNIGAFGIVIMAGKKGQENTELEGWAGVGFKFPLLGLAMTVFMFSMAGIPPTAGFIGKFLIFKAAVHEGYYWLTIFGVLNSAASVYYYLRVIVVMYFREAPEEGGVEKLRFSSASVIAAVLAVYGVLYLGVLPGSVVKLAEAAVTIF